jgi:hypothetical protein
MKQNQQETKKKLKLITQIDKMLSIMGEPQSLLNHLAHTYSLEAIKYQHALVEEQLYYNKEPNINFYIRDILEELRVS